MTMERKDMDARQKRAYDNIKYAAYNLIGTLENTLSDYDDGDTEFNMAQALLEDHEMLVDEIYSMAVSGIYREGFEGFGPQYKKMINDIKFCGREWLMAQVEARVVAEGY